MKRGTTQHPKFLALVRATDDSVRGTVGLLEMLWHATEQFHDDGGIGRWSDALIAGAIDWHGGDARQLMMTLVSLGWLDEVDDPSVRLVIHDWLCHSSTHVWDRVKKRVERAMRRGDPVPHWLVRQYEKAKEERNRNQERRDPADGSGPDASEEDAKPPPVSGCVRLRPAASDPDPRPTTQDRKASDLKSEAGGPAKAAPSPAAAAVLTFACQGAAKAWDLSADHLAELVTQWPAIDVEACLRNLGERQVRETGLRRTAAGMPRYLQSWLGMELTRHRRFLRAGAVNAPAARDGVKARAMQLLEESR